MDGQNIMGKWTLKKAIEFILCKLSPAGHGDWF